jgi:hypothetical protein
MQLIYRIYQHLTSKAQLDVILDVTDRVAVHAEVVLPVCVVLTIDGEHLLNTDLAQRKSLERRRALDANNAALTDFSAIGCIGRAAIGTVVDEERVDTGTVDENVGGVDDTEAPGSVASAVHGIVVGGLARVWLASCVGRGHVVGGLGLDEAGEDVRGLVELVLIQGVVLNAVCP